MRTEQEEANLRLVVGMFHNVLVPLDSSQVDNYISSEYIQHSQMAEPGVASLKAFLNARHIESPLATQELKRSFVDGDHVILHYHVKPDPADLGFGVIDIFRVENGLIAEHWDCVQAVPENSPNPNSMF